MLRHSYFCSVMHHHHAITTPTRNDRFEMIYANTYHKLYAVIQFYLKDNAAVKDILQECYIRLWQKMDSITDDEKIMPLLRLSATHLIIDSLRKKARATARELDWNNSQDLVAHNDESLDFRKTLQKYQAAINGLPPQQQLIFKLTREEGLSHKEIADRLQISVHTIKRHLNEALNTLRRQFPADKLAAVVCFVEITAKL